MVEFIIAFVVALVMIAIAEYTRPVPDDAKPAGLGDFRRNTASQDRKIPVIWGRPNNRGLNLVWAGDLVAIPMTTTINGLFKDDTYITGYAYFMGMHMALNVGASNCRLLRCHWDGKPVWERKGHEEGVFSSTISNGSLFGGKDSGGGVHGDFTFYPGFRGQGVDDYLASKQGKMTPEYNSVCSIVWKRGYIGNRPHMSQVEWQVERLPTALQSGKHDIGGHANAAEMLFESMTNRTWGMGIPDSFIETSSFMSCANRLFDEGFGISLIWDMEKSLDAIMKEICKHAGAVVTFNPIIGKFQMKLLREISEEDYESLIVLDESNSVLDSFSRPSIDELANEVKVVWEDNVPRKNKVAQAQDLAGYMAQDKQVVTTELDFPGIPTEQFANWVVTKELKSYAQPLGKVSLTNVHRLAYGLGPGDSFRLRRSDPEIDMVCVVTDIDYGDFKEQSIALEAIQSVFLPGEDIYSIIGPGGAESYDDTPLPVETYKLWESPYFFNRMAGLSDPEKMKPIIMAQDPDGKAATYSLWSRVWPWLFDEERHRQPFTPMGWLLYDLDRSPADTSGDKVFGEVYISSHTLPPEGFGLDSAELPDEIRLNGRNMMVIGDEILGMESITYVTQQVVRVTVAWRALLDTTKAPLHPAGSEVWMVNLGIGTTRRTYSDEIDSVDFKLIPQRLFKWLDRTQAPILTLQNGRRAKKPNPVADVRINGEPRLPFVAADADITVTWKWTNRLTQTTAEKETADAVTPESASSVILKFRDSSGNIRLTTSPIEGSSYTFTKDAQDAISAPAWGLDGANSVEVETWRGGVRAWKTETVFWHRDYDTPSGDFIDMMSQQAVYVHLGVEE